MIGEGKHGLWRVQETARIREYLWRRRDRACPRAPIRSTRRARDRSQRDYASFLPEPAGTATVSRRALSRLPAAHLRRPADHPSRSTRAATTSHPPIDCPTPTARCRRRNSPTRGGARLRLRPAGANRVGPLGRRAGFDIRENYTRVLQAEPSADARSGSTLARHGEDVLHVDWEAIDTSRTAAEYYLVERPFFNKPYLFIAACSTTRTTTTPATSATRRASSRAAKADGRKTEVTPAPRFHLATGETAPAGRPAALRRPPPRPHRLRRWRRLPAQGRRLGPLSRDLGGSGWPTHTRR